MRRKAFLILPAQAVMSGGAVLMNYWVEMPPFALVALTVCGIAGLDGGIAAIRASDRGDLSRSRLLISLGCALVTPVGLFLATRGSENRELFFMAGAWLMAASLFGTSYFCRDGGFRKHWQGLSGVWALWGSLTCLALGYSQNHAVEFYLGVCLSLALLFSAKYLFRLPSAVILSINTLFVLAVVLALSELLSRPGNRIEATPQAAKKYYSYGVAKKDSRAFARWWTYYGEQWQKLGEKLYLRDASHPLSYRLRPGSEFLMFQSRISINSKGFRGKEISPDKGRTYRIVALGESTTFGATLARQDRPWPEVLEQLIRERLKPNRPVEVINAGVPGWTLRENVQRLSADILALKPDMIISYHGFNGFRWLYYSIPPPNGPSPPKQPERPIRLLADAEHGLRMLLYKRRLGWKEASNLPTNLNPMEGTYADTYRQLIESARTNSIKLVLGTFSMAVNSKSDAEVVEFYRPAFSFVRQQIAANELHSTLVRQLSQDNPEVLCVDTRTDLDGEHEKFIDLIHLTQDGRDQLAENFFEGICDILSRELQKRNEVNISSEAGP